MHAFTGNNTPTAQINLFIQSQLTSSCSTLGRPNNQLIPISSEPPCQQNISMTEDHKHTAHVSQISSSKEDRPEAWSTTPGSVVWNSQLLPGYHEGTAGVCETFIYLLMEKVIWLNTERTVTFTASLIITAVLSWANIKMVFLIAWYTCVR